MGRSIGKHLKSIFSVLIAVSLVLGLSPATTLARPTQEEIDSSVGAPQSYVENSSVTAQMETSVNIVSFNSELVAGFAGYDSTNSKMSAKVSELTANTCDPSVVKVADELLEVSGQYAVLAYASGGNGHDLKFTWTVREKVAEGAKAITLRPATSSKYFLTLPSYDKNKNKRTYSALNLTQVVRDANAGTLASVPTGLKFEADKHYEIACTVTDNETSKDITPITLSTANLVYEAGTINSDADRGDSVTVTSHDGNADGELTGVNFPGILKNSSVTSSEIASGTVYNTVSSSIDPKTEKIASVWGAKVKSGLEGEEALIGKPKVSIPVPADTAAENATVKVVRVGSDGKVDPNYTVSTTVKKNASTNKLYVEVEALTVEGKPYIGEYGVIYEATSADKYSVTNVTVATKDKDNNDVTDKTGGTVTPSLNNTTDILCGNALTYSLAPKAGYYVAAISVKSGGGTFDCKPTSGKYVNDSLGVTAGTNYVTFDPSASKTYELSVTFREAEKSKNRFQIVATVNKNAGEFGGKVSLDGDTNSGTTATTHVYEGDPATIHFIPDEGYGIDSVTVNGVDVEPTGAYYTFTPTDVMNTVSVTYKRGYIPPVPEYTVKLTGDRTGLSKVEPAGDITASEGSSASITFTPKDGYAIAKVTDKTKAAGATEGELYMERAVTEPGAYTYTIANILQNHEITLEYKYTAYDATVQAKGAGTVTSSALEDALEATESGATAAASMLYNTDTTFTITPANGYEIGEVKWYADGVTASTLTPTAAGTVTVKGTLNDSQKLTVEFKKLPTRPDDPAVSYKVTQNVVGGTEAAPWGQIAPSVTTLVKGASQKFDFVPYEGYKLASYNVTMGGKTENYTAGSDEIAASYLLQNVSADVTITATFAEVPGTTPEPDPDPVLEMASVSADITGCGSIDNLPTSIVKGESLNLTIKEQSGWELDKASVKAVYTDEEGTEHKDALSTTKIADGVYAATLPSVDADTVVAAKFEKNEEEPPTPPVADMYYTLTVKTAGTGALLPQAGEVTVASGASTDITYKSDADHALRSVVLRWADGTRTTLTPAANHGEGFVTVPAMNQNATITFSFGDKTGHDPSEATEWAQIDASALTSGGTVSPEGRATVAKGSSNAYTVTPADGFEIASVKVEGVELLEKDVTQQVKETGCYTFENVEAKEYSIKASFAPKSGTQTDDYVPVTVFVTGSEYGSVTPTSALVKKTTGKQTFTFTASEGYTVTELKRGNDDVLSELAGSTYTIDNVADATSIYVTFASTSTPGADPLDPPAAADHAVNVTSTGSGTVVPTGLATIKSGNKQDISILPDANSVIKSITLDGTALKLSGANKDARLNDDCTRLTLDYSDVKAATSPSVLAVEFERAASEMFTVTAKVAATGGGTITPSGTFTAAKGTPRQFTLAADDTHLIEKLVITPKTGAATVVEGSAIENKTAYTYSLFTVAADTEVVAYFKDRAGSTPVEPPAANKLITFKTEPVGSGTIVPANPEIQAGIAYTFEFVPDKNYELYKVELLKGSNVEAVLKSDFSTGSYTVKATDVAEGNGIRAYFQQITQDTPPYDPGENKNPTTPAEDPEEEIGTGGGTIKPGTTPSVPVPDGEVTDPDKDGGFWISGDNKTTWDKLVNDGTFPGVTVEKVEGVWVVKVAPGALPETAFEPDWWVRVVGTNTYKDIPVDVLAGPGPDEPGYEKDPARPPVEEEIGTGGGTIEPAITPVSQTGKDGWYVSEDGGEMWTKLPSSKYPGITVNPTTGELDIEPGALDPTKDYIFRQVKGDKYADTLVDALPGPGPDEPGYKGDDKSPTPNPGKNIGTTGGEVPPATPDVPYDNGKANDKNDMTSGWFISKELGAAGSWTKLPDAAYAGVTFDNTGKVTIAPGSLKDVRDDGPDYILRQVGTNAGKTVYKDTPIYITPEPGQGGTPTGDGTPTDKEIGEGGGTIPPEDEMKPFTPAEQTGKDGWYITDDGGNTWTKLPSDAYPTITVKPDGTLDIPKDALDPTKDYIVRQVKGDKYHDTNIDVTSGPGSDDPGYGGTPGQGSGDKQEIGGGGGTVDPGTGVPPIDPTEANDPDSDTGWWISPDGGHTWVKLPNADYPGVTVDKDGKLNVPEGALDPDHVPAYVLRVVGKDGQTQEIVYKDIPVTVPDTENPGAGSPVVKPGTGSQEIEEGQGTVVVPTDELLAPKPGTVEVWISEDGGTTWDKAGEMTNTHPNDPSIKPELTLDNMAEGDYEIRLVVRDDKGNPTGRENVSLTVNKGEDSKLPKPDASVASDLVDVDVSVSTTVNLVATSTTNGSITLSADPAGYVSPSGEFTVTRGTTQDFYIFPNDDKYADSVTVTIKDAAGNVIKTEKPNVSGYTGNVSPASALVNLFAQNYYEVYKFSLANMTDAQYDIYVKFKDLPAGATKQKANVDFYTLTETESVGGTVTPGSSIVVPEGTQIGVSMYPHASNTTLDDYTVYGKSRKGDASFQRVNGELYKHTFTAEKDPAVKGASVTPYGMSIFAQPGRNTVAASSVVALAQQNQIPVAVMYSAKDAVPNPSPVPLPGTGDKAKTYKLTAKVEGGHGKITSKKSYTVTEGSNAKYTFKFQPDTGFAVATVKLDDKDPAPYSATEYTFNGKDVKSDHTIVVTFAAIGTNSDPGIAGSAERAVNKLQYLASTGDLTPPAILILMAIACGALGAAILANGRRRKKSE